ncbi:hypothetical protein [Streptomyces sp. NPDC018584]|uniref:hypothetical protein n=1 Tax=unclassified Streptomyces TaxID=2593676 RepID=UPI0037BCA102
MLPVPELIERMAACDECRKVAVEYGMNLIGSRRRGAEPHHWGLRLTTSRIHLDDHLILTHSEWLPERQPDCEVCESWREHYAIGPIVELEAWHRAEHLCEPLQEICTPGDFRITTLM